MSGIKYLRNGTDDQIFVMCKEIDWCVEVGEDVESEEERQEVIKGLPTSVYFGKEWLEDCGLMEDYEECKRTFRECITNEISDETGWLINDWTVEYLGGVNVS
jgi:hypothetical protein